MSANQLLLWMSARRQGSWQQFRAAVEELHVDGSGGDAQDGTEEDTADQYTLPLYEVLRFNLQRLGHAEFFAGAGGSDWRVTPPSLAVSQHTGAWLGVLAGARSSALLHRLNLGVASLNIETKISPACPDQFRIVTGDPITLAEVAHRAGLVLQQRAPSAILMSLPPVDDPSLRRRTDLPLGADWRIEQWTASDLGWRSATRDEACSVSFGLFRFSLKHWRHVFLCLKGAAFQVPPQIGKYVLLRRRRLQVIRYDPGRRCLSVLASCRPPLLVERALILCSGLLPSYEARRNATSLLHYADVTDDVASLGTALLRQQFQ